MPITDPYAVGFSNSQVRPAADLLAKAYNRAVAVSNRWVSLSSDGNRLALMTSDINLCANVIFAAFSAGYLAEKLWLLGVDNTFASNDSTPVYDNGNFTAQDQTRPLATCFTVNGAMARAIELQNWLQSATESFTDTARNNLTALNTILAASSAGPTLVAASAGNLVTRCGELIANYTASSNLNLNSVLAMSVNPNP